MDGDVCSCLPLQLAELAPTTVCVRIECATARVVLLGHCTLCNNGAELVCRIISGVNRAEMTGWMASGVPTETQTVFTCSHRGYVSAHKLSSVVAKCTVPK